VQLIKTADGKITYQAPLTIDHSPLIFNTLSNPRGSRVIDMTLADGSRVWLNAGSSITFPIAFVGNERKVSITGEAYFEVVHDASKPFIVSKGDMSVQVLGTHFNVNAYDDEDAVKVTLLEGSVKVSQLAIHDSKVIRPGQQASVAENIRVYDNVDLDAVLAWQRGMFEFNNTSLEAILRQVSRWYDVDVVYERKPGLGPLGGGISRDLPLSKILSLLEANGAKLKLEGKKLIVQ
jgi:ferric-dicitrate binding protein FerR (iron transport regulator)